MREKVRKFEVVTENTGRVLETEGDGALPTPLRLPLGCPF